MHIYIATGRRQPEDSRMAGRPRSARVDDALLTAALSAFVDESFAGMTMEDIASRAGVSRAALYRRWSNVEEVLLTALKAWHGQYDDTGDWPSALPGMIEAMTERAALALSNSSARSLIRRLLTIGQEGTGILHVYLADIARLTQTRLVRAIAAAQQGVGMLTQRSSLKWRSTPSQARWP